MVDGGLPRGVPQPDNGLATSGPGQWHTGNWKMNLATAVEFQSEIERLQAEIELLREAIRRLAEQDATLSVCEGAVTVQVEATLTKEEREAVE
jgi:hypothetical protein